jgi:hypothetical protein
VPQPEGKLSFSAFIGELILAWQKLAIYQEGHRQRDQAIERAHALLVLLIAPRGSLAVGVTREALLGLDEKLAAGGPARLAAALYVLEVGVLRFLEGIEPKELEQLLRLLPRGTPQRLERPLAEQLAAAGVSHIVIEAVDFSGLVATDSLAAPTGAARQVSLWESIVQRMLSDPKLQAGGVAFRGTDTGTLDGVLGVVAALLANRTTLERTPNAPSLEDLRGALASVLGSGVGEQVRSAPSAEAGRSTVRHLADLLRALPAGLREGVLDSAVREVVSGDGTALAMQQLTDGVSAAHLVGSLRRLRADKVAFSPRVVTLVEALVTASPEPTMHGQEAEPELLDQELRRVFADEDVDRAPPSQGVDDRTLIALANLQHAAPAAIRTADLDPYLETLTDWRLSGQLATTLIDLLARPLWNSEQLDWIVARQQEMFRTMIAAGRFAVAARTVETLRQLAASPARPAPVRAAMEHCLAALRRGETLTVLVDSLADVGPTDAPLHRLIEVLGPAAVRQLLLILGEETNLSRRRRLFDLLVALGAKVVEPSVELLADPRWFMARNVLSLLRRVGLGISPAVLRRGLTHSDERVRAEAVKCIPDFPGTLPADVVVALVNDPDARTAEAAIAAFGNARVVAAGEPLLALLEKADPIGRHRALRLRALQALGNLGDPAALPRLKQYFRTWFGLVSPEERRAAYAALAGYPAAARAPLLRQGLRSSDSVVRDTCRALAANSTGGGGG